MFNLCDLLVDWRMLTILGCLDKKSLYEGTVILGKGP